MHLTRSLPVCASLILVLLLVVVPAELTSAQQHPLGKPVGRTLVLRNGRVLHGSVHSEGTDFVVGFDGRGEMRIPANSVDFVCDSMQDAFQIRRQRINPGDTFELSKLADWCIRERLYNEARSVLVSVLTQDPRSPGIEQKLRTVDLLITQSQASQYAPRPTPRASLPDERARSLDEVFSADKSRSELPEYVTTELFSRYVTEIQPRLVNGCSAAKCHSGVTTSEFRLERVVRGRAMHRNAAEQNLLATLEYVDMDSPSRSALLINAGQPHGSLRTPVFAPVLSPHYKVIEKWVSEIAEARKAPGESDLESAASLASHRNAGNTHAQNSQVDQQVVKSPPQQIERPGHLIGGAVYVPLDPFDPELFNRQHFNADRTPIDETVQLPPPPPTETSNISSAGGAPNRLPVDHLPQSSRPILTPPPR